MDDFRVSTTSHIDAYREAAEHEERKRKKHKHVEGEHADEYVASSAQEEASDEGTADFYTPSQPRNDPE